MKEGTVWEHGALKHTKAAEARVAVESEKAGEGNAKKACTQPKKKEITFEVDIWQ